MISIDENEKIRLVKGAFVYEKPDSSIIIGSYSSTESNHLDYYIISNNHNCLFNNIQEIKDYITDNIKFNDPYYQFILIKNNYKITIFMRDYLNLIEYIIKNHTNVNTATFFL
jgi:hypothetical protein